MPHSDFLLGLLCRVTVAVDSGGTVVLVSQDGIQRPPFHFPKGGHLLQFLSCLENGLLPHGQLDPPLWSQRGKVSDGRGTGQLGEGGSRGQWSCLPVGPHVALWEHACPIETLGLCRWGRVCPRDCALGRVLSGQSLS